MEQSIHQMLTSYIVAHQEEFYRLAYSHVKNRDAALDVVQESIVKALSKYHSLRRPEFLKTWFYRILLNESMNYYRHHRRLASLDDSLQTLTAAQEDTAARLDLHAAIDRLTPQEQTIIRLRFFHDMKLEEIARITGTNLNTVKSRLYKSLHKLREMTGEEELYE